MMATVWDAGSVPNRTIQRATRQSATTYAIIAVAIVAVIFMFFIRAPIPRL